MVNENTDKSTPFNRKPLSKRVRFEIFKRDGFACVYCGAHPPDKILHVDHLHPVAAGGGNEPDNLVTACVDCNSGKGAVPLSSVPQSMAERAAEVEEREAQVRGYAAVMEAARQRREADIDRVAEVFERFWNDDCTLSDTARRSVLNFIEKLGVHEVLDSAEIAVVAPIPRSRAWRYFCGVCWRKVRDLGGEA